MGSGIAGGAFWIGVSLTKGRSISEALVAGSAACFTGDCALQIIEKSHRQTGGF